MTSKYAPNPEEMGTDYNMDTKIIMQINTTSQLSFS